MDEKDATTILDVDPLEPTTVMLAQHVGEAARVSQQGGGIPYEAYQPDFTSFMDGVSRGTFDGQLVEGILPLTGDCRLGWPTAFAWPTSAAAPATP